MLYTIVAVLVLVLDQAVKFYAVKCIPLMTQQTLIPGVIHMTNVQNTGAAFSIMADMRWLLVGVSAVFIIGIIVLINMDIIHTKFGRWTAVLVMAGALGNCIDRVLYGYVVDMFEFELFSFAVFNVADIFITVCGILFCLHVIIYREPAEVHDAVPRKPSKRQQRRAEPEDDDLDLDELDELDEPEEQDQAPAPRRRPARGRGRQPKEDPYANIPHRGVHRSLEEELRPQNPDDPFAEWDFGGYAGGEQPAPEPAPAPAAEERRPAPASAPRRQPAPQVEEDWDDFDLSPDPAPKAAPASRPAPASKAAPAAPQKRNAPDPGFDEYSLDDILSEFRDF